MRVCVECFADETFAKVLGCNKPAHPRSKSRVIRYVISHNNIVGLVDEDPGTTPYQGLDQFSITQVKDELKLLEWRTKKIIVIQPRLEDWLLTTAWELDVDVSDKRYGLPNDPEMLKLVINQKLEPLTRLIQDLRQSPRMKTLIEFLECD